MNIEEVIKKVSHTRADKINVDISGRNFHRAFALHALIYGSVSFVWIN